MRVLYIYSYHITLSIYFCQLQHIIIMQKIGQMRGNRLFIEKKINVVFHFHSSLFTFYIREGETMSTAFYA